MASLDVTRSGPSRRLRSVVVAVVVVALAAAVLIWLEHRGSSPARRADAVGAGRELRTPARAAGWALVSTPEARARAQRLEEQIGGTRAAGAVVVAADYTRPGAALVFVGLTAGPRAGLREDLARPSSALRAYLAQVGLARPRSFDAGDLGGALACGRPTGTGAAAGPVTCGWADSGTLGSVSYTRKGLDPAGAARLTRAFRAAVTRQP